MDAARKQREGIRAPTKGDQDLPVPIVRSKLCPPPVATDTIPRERLLSLASAVTRNPATLVSAPAGYGKSTLASHWLQRMECKTAWLSLDPGESDLTQFLSYTVAALRRAVPGSFTDTTDILQSKVPLAPGPAAGLFCNDIDQLEEPIVLVFDDYYQISSSDVDDFLDTVLKRPPENLHLVILSRWDPGLSLAPLRANGVLNEVRVRQLTFREEESYAFIRGSLGDEIPDSEIATLHNRVEGWPAALRLVILAAPEQDSTTSFTEQIPGDTHAVRTYLMQEVLAKLPAGIRKCLLRTAFLDRFCAGLCDAISPEGPVVVPAGEFVRLIHKLNLFSIALDAQQEWSRFHHLFQALLQDQALADLGEEGIREVHLRASTWFESHGFLEESIQHALRADNATEAAAVIVRHRNDIMNREQWHRLKAWLQLLPPNLIASHPELLLLKARLLVTTGRNDDLVRTLDAVESLLDELAVEDTLNRGMHGSLASMRCYQNYILSDGKGAAQEARLALEDLPADNLAERGYAKVILGAALQMTGHAKEAKSMIYAALSDDPVAGEAGVTYRTRLLISLCFIHWMDADLKSLMQTAQDAKELSEVSNLWEVATGAAHFNAAVHYHHNELGAVSGVLHQLFQKQAVYSPDVHAHCLVVSALAHQALGDLDKALQNASSLRDLAFQTHNTYLIQMAEALNAELAVRQGHASEALRWANEYDPEPLVPMYAFFSAPLCQAKILVLDGSADSHKRAEALLDRLEDYLTTTHNTRFLLETLALKAIQSERAGDGALALQQLARAVSLAQPGGFIRVFVDVGPELVPLLNRLELTGDDLQYVGRILAAFQPAGGDKGVEPSDQESGITIRDVAGLLEPLSPRENEVLVLLAERLSNKEISERLFIAIATVKRHAQAIYEKLNVKGRREAVTKAIGLGLISNRTRP